MTRLQFLLDAFLQIGLGILWIPLFALGELDHGIRFHFLPWWRDKA